MAKNRRGRPRLYYKCLGCFSQNLNTKDMHRYESGVWHGYCKKCCQWMRENTNQMEWITCTIGICRDQPWANRNKDHPWVISSHSEHNNHI